MLDLEPDEEETGFSLAVVLMGGRCGHGGTNGAIGEGNRS